MWPGTEAIHALWQPRCGIQKKHRQGRPVQRTFDHQGSHDGAHNGYRVNQSRTHPKASMRVTRPASATAPATRPGIGRSITWHDSPFNLPIMKVVPYCVAIVGSGSRTPLAASWDTLRRRPRCWLHSRFPGMSGNNAAATSASTPLPRPAASRSAPATGTAIPPANGTPLIPMTTHVPA